MNFFRQPTCRVLLAVLLANQAMAQSTNEPALSLPTPGIGLPLARVFGALVFVIALFLGGVWLFRNWQRLLVQKGRSARLNILEVRSLGARQAIYVVGYDQQRLLLASSPQGITLVTHLPPADPGEITTPSPSFAEALQSLISRRP